AADRAFAAADRARPAGSAGAVTATGGGVTGMKAFVFELSAYSVPPSPGGGGSANVVSRGGVKSTTDTDFAATLPPHPARLRSAAAGDPPPLGEGGTEQVERFA